MNAISRLLTAGPLIEGKNDGRFLPYFLHDSPLDALKQKKVSKVPLLTGTVKSETGKAITGKDGYFFVFSRQSEISFLRKQNIHSSLVWNE